MSVPGTQGIELALREPEEKAFRADVSRSFEHTATVPSVPAIQKAGTALCDHASGVDFNDERW